LLLDADGRHYHHSGHVVRLWEDYKLSHNMTEMPHPRYLRAGALFFLYHDIVYDTMLNTGISELASAQQFHILLAEREIDGNPLLTAADSSTVIAAIMLTARHTKTLPELLDSKLYTLLDMDLLGLADSWPTYQASALAIRKEYSHFSDLEWEKGRGDFLKAMIARGSGIYYNSIIREKYAERALENLSCEYHELVGRRQWLNG